MKDLNINLYKKIIKHRLILALVFGVIVFLVFYSPHVNRYSAHPDLIFSLSVSFFAAVFLFIVSLFFVSSKIVSEQAKEEFLSSNANGSNDKNWFEERSNTSGPLSLDAHWDIWKDNH